MSTHGHRAVPGSDIGLLLQVVEMLTADRKRLQFLAAVARGTSRVTRWQSQDLGARAQAAALHASALRNTARALCLAAAEQQQRHAPSAEGSGASEEDVAAASARGHGS
jgi:hypothetical protein